MIFNTVTKDATGLIALLNQFGDKNTFPEEATCWLINGQGDLDGKYIYGVLEDQSLQIDTIPNKDTAFYFGSLERIYFCKFKEPLYLQEEAMARIEQLFFEIMNEASEPGTRDIAAHFSRKDFAFNNLSAVTITSSSLNINLDFIVTHESGIVLFLDYSMDSSVEKDLIVVSFFTAINSYLEERAA